MAPLDNVLNASADPQRRRMRIRPTLKATIADLENWFAAAAPGDALEYHRGFLAMDRSVGSRLGEDDRKELDRVANSLFALAGSSRGHLLQRRHGDGDYSYLFVLGMKAGRATLVGEDRPKDGGS